MSRIGEGGGLGIRFIPVVFCIRNIFKGEKELIDKMSDKYIELSELKKACTLIHEQNLQIFASWLKKPRVLKV